jgi:hypothetical protein
MSSAKDMGTRNQEYPVIINHTRTTTTMCVPASLCPLAPFLFVVWLAQARNWRKKGYHGNATMNMSLITRISHVQYPPRGWSCRIMAVTSSSVFASVDKVDDVVKRLMTVVCLSALQCLSSSIGCRASQIQRCLKLRLLVQSTTITF